MEVESALVTGANRGIGLEFVRQLVNLPKPPRFVFATYRDESTTQALKEIRDGSKHTQVVLVKMDVKKQKEIESAKNVIEEKLGGEGLTLVINNSGVNTHLGLQRITEENLHNHLLTNTVGPILVVKEMLPLLQKAAAKKTGGLHVNRAAVLNMSAIIGSITEASGDPKHLLKGLGYRTSKAALNMAMKLIAHTVEDDGILVVSMCSGWVKTDMGTKRATLTVEESVSSMLETLPQLNEEHQGLFMERDGVIHPF